MIVNGAGSQGREMTESETMSTAMYAVVDPSTGDLVKEYPTATDEQIE